MYGSFEIVFFFGLVSYLMTPCLPRLMKFSRLILGIAFLKVWRKIWTGRNAKRRSWTSCEVGQQMCLWTGNPQKLVRDGSDS